MAAASDALVSCAHNPDFAAICSFLEQFGDKFGLLFPSFHDLQQVLECSTQVSQILVELHVKLLRQLKRSASMERWENAVVKFAHTYSMQDAWELERFGYLKANIDVKIRLLKYLLESQFDKNPKFKAQINALSSRDLRLQPLGRDRHGLRYWHLLDDDCNLRVYREDMDDESWELVASDKASMLKLIENLTSEAHEITPPETSPEDSNSNSRDDQDFLDTGQNTRLKPVPDTTAEDAGDVLTPEKETNSESRAANAFHEVRQPLLSDLTSQESNSGPEMTLMPVAMASTSQPSAPTVLSEATEAPVLLVQGEGAGADCDAGNPGEEEQETAPESREVEAKEPQTELGGSSDPSTSTDLQKPESLAPEPGKVQLNEPETQIAMASGSVCVDPVKGLETKTSDLAVNDMQVEDSLTSVAEPQRNVKEEDSVLETAADLETKSQVDESAVDRREADSEGAREHNLLIKDSLSSSVESKLHGQEKNTPPNDIKVENATENANLKEEETSGLSSTGQSLPVKVLFTTPKDPELDGNAEGHGKSDLEVEGQDERDVLVGVKNNSLVTTELKDVRISPKELKLDLPAQPELSVEDQAAKDDSKELETSTGDLLEHTLSIQDSINDSEDPKLDIKEEGTGLQCPKQLEIKVKNNMDCLEHNLPVVGSLVAQEGPKLDIKAVESVLSGDLTGETAESNIDGKEIKKVDFSIDSLTAKDSLIKSEENKIGSHDVNVEFSSETPKQCEENAKKEGKLDFKASLKENRPDLDTCVEVQEPSLDIQTEANIQPSVEHPVMTEEKESKTEIKPLPEEKLTVSEIPLAHEELKLEGKNESCIQPSVASLPQIMDQVPDEVQTQNLPVQNLTVALQDQDLDTKIEAELPETLEEPKSECKTAAITESSPPPVSKLDCAVSDADFGHIQAEGESTSASMLEAEEAEVGKEESGKAQVFDPEEERKDNIDAGEMDLDETSAKEAQIKPETGAAAKKMDYQKESHGMALKESLTSPESLAPAIQEKPEAINTREEVPADIEQSNMVSEEGLKVDEASVGPEAVENSREISPVRVETPTQADKGRIPSPIQEKDRVLVIEQAALEGLEEMEPERVGEQQKVDLQPFSANDMEEEAVETQLPEPKPFETEMATQTTGNKELHESDVAEPLVINEATDLIHQEESPETQEANQLVESEEDSLSCEPSKGEEETESSFREPQINFVTEMSPKEVPVKILEPKQLAEDSQSANLRIATFKNEEEVKSSFRGPQMNSETPPKEAPQLSKLVEKEDFREELSVSELPTPETPSIFPSRVLEKPQDKESVLLSINDPNQILKAHEFPSELSRKAFDSIPNVVEGKEIAEDSKGNVPPLNERATLMVTEEESKEPDFYNDSCNSSSNSLQIATGESPPPSPAKNEGLNGPTEAEPSLGSPSTEDNSKSNPVPIERQETSQKCTSAEPPVLPNMTTPLNTEEDKSNTHLAPPFCQSPEIHSENATTDSKFKEMVEKMNADEDPDACLPDKANFSAETIRNSHKIAKSGNQEESAPKTTILTALSMDFHGESVIPLQETLALLKQGSGDKKAGLEEGGGAVEAKEMVPKERGKRSRGIKRTNADALVMLDASKNEPPEVKSRGCRQSLRIAKLKEREDDERRAGEEQRLQRLKGEFERREKRRQYREASKMRMEEKAKNKQDKQSSKKKRKRGTSDEDSDFSPGDKKKKKKKTNTHWDSSDSSSESPSSEDELDALEQEVEEEELVFKSDHEFSPESDIGEEDSAPTRHARTARKGGKKGKLEVEEEEEEDEFSCQKCGQNEHPEWILLCDGCDGGWHVSCLKPALMVIPVGSWYCPPCEHVMLMEKLQERLEAYEYLLQQRDADIKAKQELEAAAQLAAAEDMSGDNEADEELEDDEEYDKKKSKSDDEVAMEEGEEEEDEENDSVEEESAISEDKSEEEGEEPVYRLRDRKAAQQPAYDFKAFDEMIKSAIQDDVQEEDGGVGTAVADQPAVDKEATPTAVPNETPQPPVSKGKGPRSDEEDEDEDFPRLVRRKKGRKLNDLDATSSDDSKDTDFKGSSASDDEEEEEWEAESEDSDDNFVVDESDDSDVVVFKGRDRRNEAADVRRSTRKRAPRYKMDSDSDTSVESAAASWSSGGSSDSSSDASWGGARKRKKAAKKITPPVRKPPVKKTPAPRKKPANTAQKRGRRKAQSDSDSDEESFKPRGKKAKAAPRPEEEEDTAASRRTRGKKVSYRALISSEDSISEDEPPKRAPAERKSIRPPVATATTVDPVSVPQTAAPPSPSPSHADEDDDLHLSGAEAIAEEEAEAGRADSPWDEQDTVVPDDPDASATSSNTGMGSDMPLPVPMDTAVIQHALSALATPVIAPPATLALPIPAQQTVPVHIPRTLDVQRMLHDPPQNKASQMPPEMHVSRLIQHIPTVVTTAHALSLRNPLPPDDTPPLRKLDLFTASDLSKIREDPRLKMEMPLSVPGPAPYSVIKPALMVDPNPRSFVNVIKVPEPRSGNNAPPAMPPLYSGSPKAPPLPEGVIRPSPYAPPPPYSAEPRSYAPPPLPSHPSNQFLPQPYPGYGPPRLSYVPPPRPYPYPIHPYMRPGFQHAGFPTAFATEEERRIFRVAQPPRDYLFERGDPGLSTPATGPVLEEPPKDSSLSTVANPTTTETEESEFGGLVSYFSSQQEDFDS